MPRLLVLTLFSILILAADGRGQQVPARSQSVVTVEQVWKLDAVYTDSEHGVKFQYPSVWKADIQLAYVPPALTLSDNKPIAGFAYELDGSLHGKTDAPYSNTNLEGFGIVYSVTAVDSSDRCRAIAASLSETGRARRAVLAGRSFWVYETFNFGMMQSTSGKLYATHANHMCYFFETDVAAGSEGALEGGPENVRPLTSAENIYIEARLLSIMKSVRIVAR